MVMLAEMIAVRIRFVFFTLLLVMAVSPAFGQQSGQTDAREIIRKMDLILRGDTSFGTYRMTITDPDWERSLLLKAWEKRKDNKSFIKILSPPKEAGIVTLKIKFEMWNYLPRVERIIKIPPSMMMQPWMGSDFNNDDLVKASSIVSDYTHRVVGETEFGGFQAYQVELIPRPDAPVVWGRIMVWVRQADSMPLRQEFYSEHDELIRRLDFSDIREVRGRVIPNRWEMQPVKKAGRKTTMEVIDLQVDLPIDDDVFSLRHLKQAE